MFLTLKIIPTLTYTPVTYTPVIIVWTGFKYYIYKIVTITIMKK